MPVIPLPDDPDLGQLRRQAKELRRAVLAGDAAAIGLATELHPRGVTPFPLSAAQLVIARRHGFASWPRLKAHLDVVAALRRDPGDVGPRPDPADEFLRLACLTYDADDVGRRRAAAALLAADASLGRSSIHAAAAVGDVDAVRRGIARRAGAASAVAGPYRWPPLMYLAYARHDPAIDAHAVLAVAAALLAADADPNAGYLWRGLPSPFTVVTGILGGGEQGPEAQPPHPHWQRLARLVLRAGADANDNQGLYNRMFEAGDEHLELLFEFGLGRGDGGPWRARLAPVAPSPQALVDGQLRWAVTHGMVERSRLLVEHGADPAAHVDGHSATELAALAGRTAVVAALRAGGAAAPRLGAVEGLLALLAAGDRDRALAVVAAHPGRLRAARERRPSLVVDAVAAGRAAAVELLLELGFDVDAYGRGDLPANGTWDTPLHVAAGDGRLDLVRLLLDRGADPARRDGRFDSTPLGWAEHFGHGEVAELLRQVTPG